MIDCQIGAFSPITFLHLRMFEMAYDYVNSDTKFEVVGSEYDSFLLRRILSLISARLSVTGWGRV